MKEVTLSKTKLRNLPVVLFIQGSTMDQQGMVLTKIYPSLNQDFLIQGSQLSQNERGLNSFGDTELNFSAMEFISKQLYSQKQ